MCKSFTKVIFERISATRMKRQSRTEKLIEKIKVRLDELEWLLMLPPDEVDDEEFEELRKEAIRLRDTLKMLE